MPVTCDRAGAQIPARRQHQQSSSAHNGRPRNDDSAVGDGEADIMNARDRSWQSRDETHQRASPLRSVILKEGARPLARAERARSAR